MKRLAGLERAKSKRPAPSLASAFMSAGRLRILSIFVILFLVMKAYDVTRKPESWKWFERMTTETSPEEINTKLPATAGVAEIKEGFIAHPDRPIVTKYTAADVPEATPEKIDPFDRVWRETWRDIFQHLNYDERSLFYRGMKAARDGRPLAEKFHKPMLELRDRIDQAWSAYRIEATAGLKDIPDEEKEVWLSLLQRTGGKWSGELYPAFETLAKGTLPHAEEKQALADLQSVLDAILLAMVQDDTVWRAAEAEISFRLFEKAGQLDAAAPKKATQATFLQLFKQSAEYRGELVHVRGTAKQAWHVKAPENWVGIDGYYVFILRPDDGNSPLMVYSLQLPPGFPKVPDKDIDAKTLSLNDEIEFTGFFLKRWAYTAQDGVRTSPLIIASQGRWTPPPKGLGEPMTPAELEQSLRTTGTVIGVLGFIVLLGWYFWPRSGPRAFPSTKEMQPALQELENVPTTSVNEELRRLEARMADKPE